MDDLHPAHGALRAAHDGPGRRAARAPRPRLQSGHRSKVRPGDGTFDCGAKVEDSQMGGCIEPIVVAAGRLIDARAKPHGNQVCTLRPAIAATHPVTRVNLDWI